MEEFYIEGKEKVVRVVGTVEKNKTDKETGVFIDGKGYKDENDNIWIYSYAGKPSNANEYPFFWMNNGIKEFSNPSEDLLKLWHMSNAISADLDTIKLTTNEEQLYDEKQIRDMNACGSKYVPVVLESDDFLKMLIKHVIIQKDINISRLKYKMSAKYSLPNMTAALNTSTKMSTTYYQTWAELLGFNFTISITDNGTDSINPLKGTIKYDSYHNRVVLIDENGNEEVL